MAKTPYVQSGTGSVTGYEDYPDWENWASEWPGTAATDPTRVPPPIEDYSFNFRPEEIDPALMPGGVDAYEGYSDWAQGAGVERNPFGMFNDAQFIQAYGGLPAEPMWGPDPQQLAQAGYTFGLDTKDTANRSWALDYNVFDPEGQNIGYALSAPEASPYQEFPWVEGGTPYVQDPDWSPNVDTTPTDQATCEATGGVWDGFQCQQSVGGVIRDGTTVHPLTNLPDDWLGDFTQDLDVPFEPKPYVEATTVDVGADPLSQLVSANLGSLLTTGGVAPTPLAGNVEATLRDIMGSRGAGGEAVSPLGEQAATELGSILGAQGAQPRSDLAEQTARGLERLIGAQGVRPQTALGQDVTGELQNLLATGGALPSDPQREAMELEAARTPLDILRQAQLAQGQAALSQQGLLGSGAARDYLGRLEERLAPMYTQAAQEIELGRRQREQERYSQALGVGAQQADQQAQARDTRLSTAMAQAQTMTAQEAALSTNQYITALQEATGMSRDQAERRENRLTQAMVLATGLSEEQSRNVLATAQTVTDRQRVLNDIAISILDRNMEWNEFLANYGLDRTRTIETLQQGRLNAIQPLLELYLRTIESGYKGTIGSE